MPGLRHALAGRGGHPPQGVMPGLRAGHPADRAASREDRHLPRLPCPPGMPGRARAAASAGRRARAWSVGGSTTIFDLMTFISAIELSLTVLLELSQERRRGAPRPRQLGDGPVGLLGDHGAEDDRPGAASRPAILAPGLAACLAVTAGSLLNLFTLMGRDRDLRRAAEPHAGRDPPRRDADSRWRGPSPPCGCLLFFDDRWRSERELDRPDRPLPGRLLAPVRPGRCRSCEYFLRDVRLRRPWAQMSRITSATQPSASRSRLIA